MFLTYLCALLVNYQHPVCEKKVLIVPPIEQSLNSYGENNQDYLDPNKIKVLVWNIYKSEKPNWLQDFKNYGNQNDLLLIQEALLNDTFLKSTKELDNYYFSHATSFIFKENNLATGTLNASKFNISKNRIIRSIDGEPIINTPKTISVSYLPLKNTDQQLLALNIHGLNATKTKDFKTQLNSTKKIINDHTGPVIFAGDFNTRNRSRTKFLNQFFKDLKFKTVEWPNANKRMKFMGYPLDHAFVRNLAVVKSKVRDDINSSDHKALEIELKY
jgi:endonuclease/exonuclease/phosphatase (EEP) superfamily protein YafD